MKENSSQTSRITESLMSNKEKMLNINKFSYGRDTEKPTRDGPFNILIKQSQLRPRDLMKNSVSISTDHSTSDQDFQCTESLNAMVPTTSGSEDTERTPQLNNSTSMKFLRQSSHNNGRTDPLQSNQEEDQPMFT
jgi:hypothetical protein